MSRYQVKQDAVRAVCTSTDQAIQDFETDSAFGSLFQDAVSALPTEFTNARGSVGGLKEAHVADFKTVKSFAASCVEAVRVCMSIYDNSEINMVAQQREIHNKIAADTPWMGGVLTSWMNKQANKPLKSTNDQLAAKTDPKTTASGSQSINVDKEWGGDKTKKTTTKIRFGEVEGTDTQSTTTTKSGTTTKTNTTSIETTSDGVQTTNETTTKQVSGKDNNSYTVTNATEEYSGKHRTRHEGSTTVGVNNGDVSITESTVSSEGTGNKTVRTENSTTGTVGSDGASVTQTQSVETSGSYKTDKTEGSVTTTVGPDGVGQTATVTNEQKVGDFSVKTEDSVSAGPSGDSAQSSTQWSVGDSSVKSGNEVSVTPNGDGVSVVSEKTASANLGDAIKVENSSATSQAGNTVGSSASSSVQVSVGSASVNAGTSSFNVQGDGVSVSGSESQVGGSVSLGKVNVQAGLWSGALTIDTTSPEQVVGAGGPR